MLCLFVLAHQYLKGKGTRPARQPTGCSDTRSQGSSTRQFAQVHRIVSSRMSDGDSWSDPLQATLQCHRPKQGSCQITACQRDSRNHTRQSRKTIQSLAKLRAHLGLHGKLFCTNAEKSSVLSFHSPPAVGAQLTTSRTCTSGVIRIMSCT